MIDFDKLALEMLDMFTFYLLMPCQHNLSEPYLTTRGGIRDERRRKNL